MLMSFGNAAIRAEKASLTRQGYHRDSEAVQSSRPHRDSAAIHTLGHRRRLRSYLCVEATIATLERFIPRTTVAAHSYSYLRATIGSTLEARRAGSKAAAAPTKIIKEIDAATVVGSVAPIPKSIVDTRRVAASVTGTPMTMPIKIKSMLSFSTVPRTLVRVAPSASRIPISAVLLLTV